MNKAYGSNPAIERLFFYYLIYKVKYSYYLLYY